MEKKQSKSKLQELQHRIDRNPAKIKQSKKNLLIIVTTELFAGIFIGAFLGYYTDQYMETLPIFVASFSILGFFAALLNIYRSVYKN